MTERNSYAELPVEELTPAAYNPNELEGEDFAQLIDEVKRQGRVLKPIVVRRTADDGYIIVDGEHTWRAARSAGLDTVPVEIVVVDEFEARRQTYKRNLSGRNHRVRLGRMFGEMLADRNLTNRELAAELGVTEGTVRNALLYAEAVALCAAIEPPPFDEDQIAAMSVRAVRDLVAKLRGLTETEGTEEVAPPAEAAIESTRVKRMKKDWELASRAERSAFTGWAGLIPLIKVERKVTNLRLVALKGGREALMTEVDADDEATAMAAEATDGARNSYDAEIDPAELGRRLTGR